MTKHKKKRDSRRRPILPSRGAPGRTGGRLVSLQAEELGRSLSSLTRDQLLQRLERNLLGAIALRNEPEFADFFFDGDAVLEVTASHLDRYEARLTELEKRGDREALQELYDLMRIDVVAELVTSEVRRDLQERTRRCIERLKQGREADKLEMALYVDVLLSGQDKVIPLGLCGLFTAIYEDSLRRVETIGEAEQALRKALADLLPEGRDLDAVELLAAVERPEVVARFTQILESHPGLRDQIEQDLDRMIEEVGQAIHDGKIAATFFTEEEVLRIFADLALVLGEAVSSPKPPDQQAVMETLTALMEQNLSEIMTRERSEQFRLYLQKAGSAFQRSADRQQKKLGVRLLLAAETLKVWEPGKHPLVFEVYLAQLKQIQEEGITRGWSAERQALFQRLVAERQGAASSEEGAAP